MNPIKVFGVLAALLAAVAALALLSRDEPRTPTPAEAATPTTDLSLTDAEAIARFKELDQLRLQALRKRDASIAQSVFTENSQATESGIASIRRLREEDVLFRTTYETLDLQVVSNSSDEVVVRQRVVVRPRFVTEAGKDVTGRQFAERRVVEWTLHQVAREWLLYDGVVIDAERLKR